MEISKGIRIIDLALLFQNNLLISDVHLGYEGALNKQGLLIPRLQFKDMIKRAEKILEMAKLANKGKFASHDYCRNLNQANLVEHGSKSKSENLKRINPALFQNQNDSKLEKIIINGDLKHEFGNISGLEWRQTLQFIDFLSMHCREVVLVKGNHDKILGPIAEKRGIKVFDSLEINRTLIIHGDKLPKKISKNISRIIIGHEHPAVSLKEHSRIETFKCFLKRKWKGKELIVQPSFNIVTEGTDILKEEILSPFLRKGLSDFEVFLVADKIYRFGKLKTLKDSLV